MFDYGWTRGIFIDNRVYAVKNEAIHSADIDAIENTVNLFPLPYKRIGNHSKHFRHFGPAYPLTRDYHLNIVIECGYGVSYPNLYESMFHYYKGDTYAGLRYRKL